MPPGCFTSRVCEPYFSVASTYGFGKVQGCCTPTWISTSSGIFQNRSPCHKRCSPYEKQSLYCVQFCLVMTVPGLTSQSANAAAGAKIPKQITSSKPKRVEKLISPCLLFQKVTICKGRSPQFPNIHSAGTPLLSTESGSDAGASSRVYFQAPPSSGLSPSLIVTASSATIVRDLRSESSVLSTLFLFAGFKRRAPSSHVERTPCPWERRNFKPFAGDPAAGD